LAEPGGVIVSESIQVAVRGRIAATFEDLGEQEVKNIAQPSTPTGSPSVRLPLSILRGVAMPCMTSLQSRSCPLRT
jgi:hypothetical protein